MAQPTTKSLDELGCEPRSWDPRLTGCFAQLCHRVRPCSTWHETHSFSWDLPALSL